VTARCLFEHEKANIAHSKLATRRLKPSRRADFSLAIEIQRAIWRGALIETGKDPNHPRFPFWGEHERNCSPLGKGSLLSLVRSEKKLLVLTDGEFYRLFCKQSAGLVADGIEILHCPLPENLEKVKKAVRAAASSEMDDGKARV
jgi:hypothetical protein